MHLTSTHTAVNTTTNATLKLLLLTREINDMSLLILILLCGKIHGITLVVQHLKMLGSA